MVNLRTDDDFNRRAGDGRLKTGLRAVPSVLSRFPVGQSISPDYRRPPPTQAIHTSPGASYKAYCKKAGVLDKFAILAPISNSSPSSKNKSPNSPEKNHASSIGSKKSDKQKSKRHSSIGGHGNRLNRIHRRDKYSSYPSPNYGS